MATREMLADIMARHLEVTGRPVVCAAAGGVDVAKRVQAGEDVDVVILARPAIDALIAAQKLLADSRVDLVRSGIAVAVRAGAPKPDIGAEDGLKKAVLAARTVSYSTGPSGVYLEKMFERWGILEAIRSRTIVPAPGIAVGSLIAAGTVELGFQQLSELLPLENVDVVGPLPPSIQSITVFSGGIAARCRDAEAATALLGFMASPEVKDIKTRHGMEAA
jgi:molybdate transport system substrate-binding protein